MEQLLDATEAVSLAANVVRCVSTDTDFDQDIRPFLKLLHFCWNAHSGTAVWYKARMYAHACWHPPQLLATCTARPLQQHLPQTRADMDGSFQHAAARVWQKLQCQ